MALAQIKFLDQRYQKVFNESAFYGFRKNRLVFERFWEDQSKCHQGTSLGKGDAFLRELNFLLQSNLEFQDQGPIAGVVKSQRLFAVHGLLASTSAQTLQKMMGSSVDFIKGWNLNEIILIIDSRPFIGTQTILWSMLNGINLAACFLDSAVIVHGQDRYEGAWGVMGHDIDHANIWERVKQEIKKSGDFDVYMSYLIDSYHKAVVEPHLAISKKILDFLFILVHEDSDLLQQILLNQENSPSRAQFLKIIQSCNLPSTPTFKDLSKIISSNQGYEDTTEENYSLKLQKLRGEVLGYL